MQQEMNIDSSRAGILSPAPEHKQCAEQKGADHRESCTSPPAGLWRMFRHGTPRHEHPVAPGSLPVLGHLPLLYFDAAGLLRRGQERVGPVFWVDLGFGHERLFCLGPESLE